MTLAIAVLIGFAGGVAAGAVLLGWLVEHYSVPDHPPTVSVRSFPEGWPETCVVTAPAVLPKCSLCHHHPADCTCERGPS